MSDELAAIQEQTFAAATKATADSYPPGRRLAAYSTIWRHVTSDISHAT
jgi:hypothetical protein